MRKKLRSWMFGSVRVVTSRINPPALSQVASQRNMSFVAANFLYNFSLTSFQQMFSFSEDLGRCSSIPNEMPYGLVVETNDRGPDYEYPVGGMVGLLIV